MSTFSLYLSTFFQEFYRNKGLYPRTEKYSKGKLILENIWNKFTFISNILTELPDFFYLKW